MRRHHAVPDEAALDALVWKLFALGAPKLFVWLVVLVFFNTSTPLPAVPFEMLEFFAGDAAITKSGHFACLATAALDLRYGARANMAGHPRGRTLKQNPFDMATDVGFAFLDRNIVMFFLLFN